MQLSRSKRFALYGTFFGLVIISGAALFVYFGVYNVSALQQHTTPVYRLLQFAMVRSVAVRADAEPPDLMEYDWEGRGLVRYEQHCQQCHGAPGVAPAEFSLGMVPAPTAIAEIATKRDAAEIFWVIKHGIKMSGMPAWQYRMTNKEIWEVVAFIQKIPNLTVAQYRQHRNAANETKIQPDLDSHDFRLPEDRKELVRRGRIAMQQYNCTSCHSIPGVTAGRNHVGPPLGGITQRAFIAGLLPTTKENLVRWIRFPQQVDPNTTMPNLGVSAAHAEEMVAYLMSTEE